MTAPHSGSSAQALKVYRVAVEGNAIGEMTLDQMVDATVAKTLPADAEYFQEGANRWRPVAQIVQPRLLHKTAGGDAAPARRASDAPPPANPQLYVMLGRGMAAVFVVLAFVGGFSGLILLQNVWLALYLVTSLLWLAFFSAATSEVIALLARIEHNTRK